MRKTLLVFDAVEFIYCACGCGKTRQKYDKLGIERKFVNGHSSSKGRKFKDGDGYIVLNINGKKFKEHRYIYEQHHKVCLLKWTDVHHINGIRDDNRIENLEALIKNEHSRITFTKDKSNRICDICTSQYTKYWFSSPLGNYLCRNCYLLINKRILLKSL